MKKATEIILYVVTVLLCSTLFVAVLFLALSDGNANDLQAKIMIMRDVVFAVIPLIGICVMFIIINNKHSSHKTVLNSESK